MTGSESMNPIAEIMSLEASQWIRDNVGQLPDCGKFRAHNALRSLNWAIRIFDSELPIPANFCALHATEEAVAAVISTAKYFGYKDAKKINIRDHRHKATVSLLAEKVGSIFVAHNLAIALHPKNNFIAARYDVDGIRRYREASTKLFHFRNNDGHVSEDFFDVFIAEIGDVDALKAAVKQGTDGRNAIFYASGKGYPTGFHEPEKSLSRECQISLGLIWLTLDIKRNADEIIPFVQQALRTVILATSQPK